MDKYELVVILDASLSQGDKDAVVKDVTQAIEKCSGKVISSQVWIEKHKMTFPMKKRSEGTYYLIIFEGGSSKLPDLRLAMKHHDGVLRSLLVKAQG